MFVGLPLKKPCCTALALTIHEYRRCARIGSKKKRLMNRIWKIRRVGSRTNLRMQAEELIAGFLDIPGSKSQHTPPPPFHTSARALVVYAFFFYMPPSYFNALPLWSTKEVKYEGRLARSYATFISMQPLGGEHANIPHIKAMDVPFLLIYGSLICAKRLQSERQNKVGCLQTPGRHQYLIIKYLSVGRWSWFLYQ